MRSVIHDRFGTPDTLRVGEVTAPEMAADGILVEVRAVSLNKADWYTLTGTPWLARPTTGLIKPKGMRLGIDFAGVVESVGPDVTGYSPGDRVFGGGSGTLAELVLVRRHLARIPEGIGFAEASTLPTAGVTALQALRDHGAVRATERVLVNGASGGVGTLTVQLAKQLGAEVTAVCSTRNVEQSRALGADRVIDYRTEDFTKTGDRYDLIIDVVGSRPWRHLTRVLGLEARVVVVGGPSTSRLLGPLGHIAGVMAGAKLSRRGAAFFIAKFNPEDLGYLAVLLGSGALRPVIDATYPIDQVDVAFRQLGEGHAQGKVIVEI